MSDRWHVLLCLAIAATWLVLAVGQHHTYYLIVVALWIVVATAGWKR